MPRGYDRPLYILPFDHRGAFEARMSDRHGPLTAMQAADVATAKRVIYDGFKAAIASGAPRASAGIQVDEQFGAAILRDAAANGFVTVIPADFEYGEDFAAHIEAFEPTFCKARVRYDPGGDAAMNRVPRERLRRLSDYLAKRRSTRFILELLAPPGKAVLAQAIEALQDAGIEPDVWMIEGLDRQEDCSSAVAAARRGGRAGVGCIALGRGENDAKVHRWLSTAAGVPGFIGFAVGRADLWQPLVDWRASRITRDAAVAEVARRYREFLEIFESNDKVKILKHEGHEENHEEHEEIQDSYSLSSCSSCPSS
jgi:5-dehydro-2-deoxygluconokinase